MTVIASFNCKTTDCSINQNLSPVLSLNPNKTYMLSLVSVNYSNVFSNLDYARTGWNINIGLDTFVVNYEFPSGIYEIAPVLETLNSFLDISKYKPALTGQLATFTLDTVRGFVSLVPNITLINDNDVSINFNNHVPTSIFRTSFLEMDFGYFFNYNYLDPATLKVYVSTTQPSIASYNSLNISSSLINFSSYQTKDSGNMRIENVLITLPANSSPYQYNTFIASVPLNYLISKGTTQIGIVQFEMTDDSNNKLKIVPGTTTDLNIYCQILQL